MDLQTRARLAEATLDLAVFGFNPGQRRGPDGRYIKMGGSGSAGKSAPAVGRAPRPKSRPSEGGGAGAGGGSPAAAEPADVRDGLSAALAKEAAARAALNPEPAAEPVVEPPIGPDGKYIKPVKQVAVWNGQVATRTSRTPYKYAAVVKYPGPGEPVIVSWHKTHAAASKGVLTGMQRKNGIRVVGVAEARPEAPGQSAMDSWERKRLDDLEATARERHGPDESQWPAALLKNIKGLRKQRDAATMARMADSNVFRMPGDLADYWIRGEGAARIRWCTEGAFERARDALREHVPDHMLDGTVANLYKRACGKWPGQDRD